MTANCKKTPISWRRREGEHKHHESSLVTATGSIISIFCRVTAFLALFCKHVHSDARTTVGRVPPITLICVPEELCTGPRVQIMDLKKSGYSFATGTPQGTTLLFITGCRIPKSYCSQAHTSSPCNPWIDTSPCTRSSTPSTSYKLTNIISL